MVRWSALPLLALTCASFAGCSPPDPPATTPSADRDHGQRIAGDAAPIAEEAATWIDVAAESGLRVLYSNGQAGKQFTLLESVGGGVALLDFDADGDLDLFFPGGGTISAGTPLVIAGLPCRIFRNDGRGHFSDVEEGLTSDQPLGYSHGAFAGDFDRDGFPDVLVTTFHGVRLLRNRQGTSFQDVTAAAGLQRREWVTAACWADADRDGWPDLFVTGYAEWDGTGGESCGDADRKIRDVCPPQRYPAARQRVYRNNRDGTFSEVEGALEGEARGKGLGVLALDLNQDGWIDFYVANDQVANQLYLGGPEFRFRETALAAGVAGNEFGAPEGSMGVDAGDFNGDGQPDLWTTNYELEDNSLYQNQGEGQFQHATITAGLGGQSRIYVGFGTGLVDFDVDGWLDLFVINGHVLYETGRSPYLQPSFLYRNEARQGQRRFRDITRQSGAWFQKPRAGRGAAVGDLDGDGDPDLVVVEQNGPASLLRNPAQPKHWVGIELRGTTSDPRAVGAVVEYAYGTRTLVRHVRSGAGYLSDSDPRILLPSLPDGPGRVRVRWLGGAIESYRELKPNAMNRLWEGRGEPD